MSHVRMKPRRPHLTKDVELFGMLCVDTPLVKAEDYKCKSKQIYTGLNVETALIIIKVSFFFSYSYLLLFEYLILTERMEHCDTYILNVLNSSAFSMAYRTKTDKQTNKIFGNY